MPSGSVTIVNTNARDLVRECLQSLNRHPYTRGSMEIVVLDNASDDGSVEMLEDEFPGVIVLTEKVRRGFGANQNRAIAASTGQLAFILNPDAVVGAGTINGLAQAMWPDERVVAAGCPTLNVDGTARQESPNPFPTPLSIYSKAFGLGKIARKYRPVTDVFDFGWLSGGAMLIDRQIFMEIGGFDESFFIYSEDVDLCRRLRASGYLFAWAPNASVVHPLPKESPEMMQRRQYELVKSELSYMRKYYGTTGQYVYRVGAALDSAIRVLVLRLPGISRVVSVHGTTTADIRGVQRARLRAVLRPHSGKGIADLAATWNSNRAQAGLPSATKHPNEVPDHENRPADPL